MKIGIDLGTTYSAFAYMDHGKPTMLANADGDFSTPSVVMFDEDEIVVGTSAKEQSIIDPSKVVAAAKDHMGTQKVFEIGDSSYRPEEISACIIKKIVKDASDALGDAVTDVVVTIPAYFNDAQRTATEDACRMASVNLLQMINEPTAAALCYLHGRNAGDTKILVYDLGGGTFDASIVEFHEGRFKVIATGGIRKLGGHFFDQMIVDKVVDYVQANHGIDLYETEFADILQEVNVKAEKCKIRLSSKQSADIIFRVADAKVKYTLMREDFEKLIDRFYRRTESTVRMVMSDADISFEAIDKVILVGGSSRIPFIREQLKLLTGIDPSADVNPDEAVALGAAILTEDDAPKPIDVCSHSLGVVVLNEIGSKINAIVIPRNSTIPLESIKQFVVPYSDVGTIVMDLTEGEGTDIDYVNVFADIEIDVPEMTKVGTPVDVKFQLDGAQMLHVETTVRSTPEIKKRVHIDRKNNLSSEEVERKRTALAVAVIS